MMKPILVIPDIHGRTFWRKALNMHEEYSHIVFLGDYFDPYPSEGISEVDAINNFHELLSVLHTIPQEKITMLMGNHDAHYLNSTFDSLARGSRKSRVHKDEIKELLALAGPLKIAWECTLNNRHCLFTHAGVTRTWLDNHKELLPELNADHLNALMDSEEGWVALSCVGFMRGGIDESGGPLWCDISEHLEDKPLTDVYQIFGHSQLPHEPYVGKNFSCVDTHEVFIFDGE